ncbi:MAG: two-component system sensor histidine kinase NtrB [Planctomycetota bacterium]|jgi:signal transduction histidine kinase
MAAKVSVAVDDMDRPSQCRQEVLVEQLLWLIQLRWIAVAGVVGVVLVCSYIFPVVTNPTPVYVCTGVLLLSNIFYYSVATKKGVGAGVKDIVLGMVQVEADLVILTMVLHFSGGVINPFFLFYIFHVIIAAIMLPRNLSYVVGLTAILLFGLLAVNELNGGGFLGYYPLAFSAVGGLWRNPVYVLGAFVGFACTVVLAQYLTRIIIVRMTAKELEAAQHSDVLKAIIGAMSEGLIFVTNDGEVAICNPAAKQWKKNNSFEMEGESLDDFPSVLSNHIKGLLSNSDKAAGSNQVVEFLTPGSEARHIEAKSCSVTGIDGQQLGYVVVGQDLTKHKELEKDLRGQTEQIIAINEMLKMTRVQMAHREKMVAIGQMAAGIAHEIGNPLASLSSVAQYLCRKLSTHEEKEQLLLIEYQVERISGILKHMLSLSRPATREYKWTNINELIDNTLSLVKFDKRMHPITIKNIPCTDLPMVWLNPQLFEQVLLNIFINALDAMNAKVSEQERVLVITRELKEGMIEIRISDTGIGMSPEVANHAFESFFTTKEIGKGTGLGLFISYNLVSELDGTIKIESEVGKGTTVIIRVPIRPKKDLIVGEVDKGDFIDSVKTINPGGD